MSIHRFCLHGLRFHFRDWPCSKDDAQDLVLVHGFTGHARSWDVFAQAMSTDYRVLALDQPDGFLEAVRGFLTS